MYNLHDEADIRKKGGCIEWKIVYFCQYIQNYHSRLARSLPKPMVTFLTDTIKRLIISSISAEFWVYKP